MGLFSKKPPCAICGGKVGFFLPMKIEGEYICDDCAGKIDMPDDMKNALTMESLREYLSFYGENRQLASQFQVSAQVGLSPFRGESVFDFENRLFCMDPDLKKLVFHGEAIRGFTISEDRAVIFEGTPQGLKCHESGTIAKVQLMAPQAAMIQMQRRMEREQQMRDQMDGDKDGQNRSIYHEYVDFPEPFKNFNINIRLHHPYYSCIAFKHSGPTILGSDPDIPGYIREYEEDFERMRFLADALMRVAFPGARYLDSGAPAAAAGIPVQPVDTISEIKKYKELLDGGIITQDEFDAKKRQLMGI